MSEQPTKLPHPQTYELEYAYWPWGRVIAWVATWVEEHAPENAVVVDYMCGTGYLLNQIASRRPDLSLIGCSLTPEYIAWAKDRYPRIQIVHEDALCFRPRAKPDIIMCTAGLHHLQFEKQPEFLQKVAEEMKPGGSLVVAEEVVSVDTSGPDRQLAVTDLWSALIRYAINAGAPDNVLEAAVEVMRSDLVLDGEYKRSAEVIEAMLESYFEIVTTSLLWPNHDVGFGDRVWVCRLEQQQQKARS